MRKLAVFLTVFLLCSSVLASPENPTEEEKKEVLAYIDSISKERALICESNQKFGAYIEKAFEDGKIPEDVYETISRKFEFDEKMSYEQSLERMRRESKYNPLLDLHLDID